MPDQIRIAVGSADILATGSIVGNGYESVVFYPLPAPYQHYRVELGFAGGEGKGARIETAQPAADLFRITLIDFFSPNPVGNKQPIYVANYAGRKILLSFIVYFAGPTPEVATKYVHYTFIYGDRH